MQIHMKLFYVYIQKRDINKFNKNLTIQVKSYLDFLLFLNKIKLMKNFLNSRVVLYVFFSLFFYFWWKVAGFEVSMMIALGSIVGEQTYIGLEKNKKSNEED